MRTCRTPGEELGADHRDYTHGTPWKARLTGALPIVQPGAGSGSRSKPALLLPRIAVAVEDRDYFGDNIVHDARALAGAYFVATCVRRRGGRELATWAELPK